MAITTRFGNPVKITWQHEDYDETGWVEIQFLDGIDKDKERSIRTCELRADGGIVEIDAAAKAASVHPGRTNFASGTGR